MQPRALFASKRCPHCGAWSDHQHRPDDRCQHCHELLDPQGPQRAADLQKAWQWEMPPVMLIPILPTDSRLVRLFKHVVRGGQLLFAATISFILWLIAAVAG
ncbi:hypothetical protein GCM10027048_00410 [Hymenobacter coalescens]